MEVMPVLRGILVICCCLVLADPAAAADGALPDPDPAAGLQEARQCLKAGEYDRAAEILEGVIPQVQEDVGKLGEAYLLLISTNVQRGNSFRDQPNGRATAELWYREARQSVVECLGVKQLRHLEPDPPGDYPPEMLELFRLVREEMFGGFRVVGLRPPDGLVVFDGDTLRADCAGCPLELKNVPTGTKRVVVSRSGYRTHRETVQISRNSVLERSFALEKGRGPFWLATRITPVILAAGYWVFGRGGEGGGAGETALPDPPPPPSQ